MSRSILSLALAISDALSWHYAIPLLSGNVFPRTSHRLGQGYAAITEVTKSVLRAGAMVNFGLGGYLREFESNIVSSRE